VTKIFFSVFFFSVGFLMSCSYDTKEKCHYIHHHQMKMKKLIEKCNYIEYGDTWVKKDI